jgi:phage baseplate assembly protein W|tara:strand:- start:1304 stop:1729 length:426 start_codon:yes stop_codon:yes gene_type:complete
MAQYDSSTTSTSNRNSRPFKDIDLDFGRNTVTNDVMTVTDIVAIKRSVKNLIQTNFYERPFHPEMGCGVRELLFENFTPITGVFIKRKIAEVITNFEPRVTLNSVHLDDDPDNNRLVVDIYFYVTGIPGPQQVSTFLQRLR